MNRVIIEAEEIAVSIDLKTLSFCKQNEFLASTN